MQIKATRSHRTRVDFIRYYEMADNYSFCNYDIVKSDNMLRKENIGCIIGSCETSNAVWLRFSMVMDNFLVFLLEICNVYMANMSHNASSRIASCLITKRWVTLLEMAKTRSTTRGGVVFCHELTWHSVHLSWQKLAPHVTCTRCWQLMPGYAFYIATVTSSFTHVILEINFRIQLPSPVLFYGVRCTLQTEAYWLLLCRICNPLHKHIIIVNEWSSRVSFLLFLACPWVHVNTSILQLMASLKSEHTFKKSPHQNSRPHKKLDVHVHFLHTVPLVFAGYFGGLAILGCILVFFVECSF